MNVADVLDRAADVMDARGKCAGHYMNDSGQVCALGAMAVVLGAFDEYSAEMLISTEHMRPGESLLRSVLDLRIVDWNDISDHATVTSTLRACAAVERARAAVAETVPA